MIFRWETMEDRARKHMKIPPQKKMEWLFQMHQLILKTSSKHSLAIRQKLREKRSYGSPR